MKKIAIILFLLSFCFSCDGEKECDKHRSVNIQVPMKETSEVLLRCTGSSYFKHFSYVYWLVGESETVDQLQQNSGYGETSHPSKPHECGNLPSADLVLTNMTEKMRDTKLTCVLMDPDGHIDESLVLREVWDCFNKT
ncbi:14L [Yaba monkey tumor virus]|uniref:14L n=1 Tax=Yaba monkey tumor virus (strain VR587) TaxID=928314 RepID=Q6TUZ6_YMTV5|nr:IL-18 binding protein [Yaba monkey tumor virus]AAR07373.1 14L [Yaba monkey tumor virus]